MKKREDNLLEIEETEPRLRAFIMFSQAARGMLKYKDAYLYRKARLSVVQLIALKALAKKGGVLTPSEIAECTQTERHNITALVQRMKKDGMIKTEHDVTDRRVVNVILTYKGRDALSKAIPLARDVMAKVMASISEDDAVRLEKLMLTLRNNAEDGMGQLSERT